jgi:hypothetical protein
LCGAGTGAANTCTGSGADTGAASTCTGTSFPSTKVPAPPAKSGCSALTRTRRPCVEKR